jgi:hypothetical protein
MNDRDTVTVAFASLRDTAIEYMIAITGKVPDEVTYWTKTLAGMLYDTPDNVAGKHLMHARADELRAAAEAMGYPLSVRARVHIRAMRIALLDRADDLDGISGRTHGDRNALSRR